MTRTDDERIRADGPAVIKKSERALEELRTRPWQHATSLVCTDAAFEELEEQLLSSSDGSLSCRRHGARPRGVDGRRKLLEE